MADEITDKPTHDELLAFMPDGAWSVDIIAEGLGKAWEAGRCVGEQAGFDDGKEYISAYYRQNGYDE